LFSSTRVPLDADGNGGTWQNTDSPHSALSPGRARGSSTPSRATATAALASICTSSMPPNGVCSAADRSPSSSSPGVAAPRELPACSDSVRPSTGRPSAANPGTPSEPRQPLP
jgi:hypothetical protein